MKPKWQFENNIPEDMKEGAQKAFHPVTYSAVLNMSKKYNHKDWQKGDAKWMFGTIIGKVEAIDQFGDSRIWEVMLYESGGIMRICEGASRWQIRIETIE